MQLTLSSDNVRNAIFTNESGQVLYKTTQPVNIGGTTTFYKVVTNEDPMDMRDRFEVMGEIEWRFFESSTFRIGGKEMQAETFFPKHGFSGRKRTFMGPDGLPYRWDMLFHQMVLSRDDASKTEVARYRLGSLGIVGPKKMPQLDVNPEVIHMLDLIILTFVYVEKLHMRKESRTRGCSGGSGSS